MIRLDTYEDHLRMIDALALADGAMPTAYLRPMAAHWVIRDLARQDQEAEDRDYERNLIRSGCVLSGPGSGLFACPDGSLRPDAKMRRELVPLTPSTTPRWWV